MEKKLTSRSLFLKIMSLKPCERTLNWEFGFWGGTLNRWYEEGLPRVKGLPKEVTYGEPVPGPGVPWGELIGGVVQPRDSDVSGYFDFDDGLTLIPFNYWLCPPFEEKTIDEDEKYIELYDADGIRKRTLKDDSSMPFWLEWPVKTRKDWEKIKEERFNVKDIGKRYADNTKEFLDKAPAAAFPVGIFYYPIGFFGSIRYLVGDKNLFLLYYDDPSLVSDILDYLCDLWIQIAEELIPKIGIDISFFWEDMSGKTGSLISPATFREFMTPRYKRLIDFLKTKGIKSFAVDSDGNVNELIPLFLESGINGLMPFEQQAGNDLLDIRKKFPQLRMMGGFDKNTLYKGKEYIDRELEKMPWLIKQGGYIPFGDHIIPPNASWENYKYYRKRLWEIIDSTGVL